MSKVIAYLRVSKREQNLDAQRQSINSYIKSNNMIVNEWIEVKTSSTKGYEKRKIDELINVVDKGDTIIIAEISRLARSINQLTTIVNDLGNRGVNIIFVKESLKIGKDMDITSKIVLFTFGILAEVARDLHSMRVREGLSNPNAKVRNIPNKGKKHNYNKLQGEAKEVKKLLDLGLSKTKIAKYFKVNRNTLDTYLNYFYDKELGELKGV